MIAIGVEMRLKKRRIFMRKYNELQLIEEKELRESFIDRTEVLDKVGDFVVI